MINQLKIHTHKKTQKPHENSFCRFFTGLTASPHVPHPRERPNLRLRNRLQTKDGNERERSSRRKFCSVCRGLFVMCWFFLQIFK